MTVSADSSLMDTWAGWKGSAACFRWWGGTAPSACFSGIILVMAEIQESESTMGTLSLLPTFHWPNVIQAQGQRESSRGGYLLPTIRPWQEQTQWDESWNQLFNPLQKLQRIQSTSPTSQKVELVFLHTSLLSELSFNLLFIRFSELFSSP